MAEEARMTVAEVVANVLAGDVTPCMTGRKVPATAWSRLVSSTTNRIHRHDLVDFCPQRV
jgi:hypothetical protein